MEVADFDARLAHALNDGPHPALVGRPEDRVESIRKLVSMASQSVAILGRTLDARIFGPSEIVTEMRLFLAHDKNARIRILLREIDDHQRMYHPLLVRLGEHPHFDLRVLPPELPTGNLEFVAADKDRYSMLPQGPAGLGVAARDPAMTGRLFAMFDNLWERTPPFQAVRI